MGSGDDTEIDEWESSPNNPANYSRPLDRSRQNRNTILKSGRPAGDSKPAGLDDFLPRAGAALREAVDPIIRMYDSTTVDEDTPAKEKARLDAQALILTTLKDCFEHNKWVVKDQALQGKRKFDASLDEENWNGEKQESALTDEEYSVPKKAKSNRRREDRHSRLETTATSTSAQHPSGGNVARRSGSGSGMRKRAKTIITPFRYPYTSAKDHEPFEPGWRAKYGQLSTSQRRIYEAVPEAPEAIRQRNRDRQTLPTPTSSGVTGGYHAAFDDKSPLVHRDRELPSKSRKPVVEIPDVDGEDTLDENEKYTDEEDSSED